MLVTLYNNIHTKYVRNSQNPAHDLLGHDTSPRYTGHTNAQTFMHVNPIEERKINTLSKVLAFKVTDLFVYPQFTLRKLADGVFFCFVFLSEITFWYLT